MCTHASSIGNICRLSIAYRTNTVDRRCISACTPSCYIITVYIYEQNMSVLLFKLTGIQKGRKGYHQFLHGLMRTTQNTMQPYSTSREMAQVARRMPGEHPVCSRIFPDAYSMNKKTSSRMGDGSNSVCVCVCVCVCVWVCVDVCVFVCMHEAYSCMYVHM